MTMNERAERVADDLAADAAPTRTAAPSEIASSLADGVVRTMFMSKLKRTAVLAVLAVVIAGAGALAAAPPDSPRERYQIKAPVPKAEAREQRILFWLDDKPQLLGPDGIELKSPAPVPKASMGVGWGHLRLSHDGKWLAFERSGAAAQLPPAKAAPEPSSPGTGPPFTSSTWVVRPSRKSSPPST